MRQVTTEVLTLATELRKGTIDRIMAMSDLELGLGPCSEPCRQFAPNPILDIACNTLPCTFTRMGLPHLIAPEGEVSAASTLQRARAGISYLAAVTGAPVLPVGSIGQENLFANARRLRRIRIRVEFGEPFVITRTELTPAALAATSETIMRRIAATLPPEYRGAYSD